MVKIEMKIITKNLILVLILSSLIIPFVPILAEPKTSQDAELRIRFAIGDQMGDWDNAVYHAAQTDVYRYACLENLCLQPYGWDGDPNKLIPQLATSWDIEYWPEEMNAAGFINSGGIKAVNFTLRENVTFHDGSIWNATVAKWNIDRLFIISGDLTGNGDTYLIDFYWQDAIDFENYFTPSWNLSWAIGKMPSYNAMVATNPSLLGAFPKINKTIVLDGGGSNGGGVFRVEFNGWEPFAFYDFFHGYPGSYVYMLSMEAYKDYWDKPIFGYGETPGFIQGVDINHLIGTGAYKFDHHTGTGGTIPGGLMVKNENWWNRTALEAAGWFQLTHVDTVLFPMVPAGVNQRNIAMENDIIDVSYDYTGWNFNYDAVMADPDLLYAASGFGFNFMTSITLNAINETYWKDAWDNGVWAQYPNGSWYMTIPPHTVPEIMGTKGVNGIPRLLRKAISYAFDYDGFIQTAYNGRAYRPRGYLHVNNTYRNPSIPAADYDLKTAREAMLAQYPSECAARGLTASITDNTPANNLIWQTQAQVDPIHTLDFYWDTTADKTILKDYLETALGNIACDYIDDTLHELSPTLWDFLKIWNFPIYTAQAWPLDYTVYSTDIIHPFIDAYYKNPGNWSFTTSFNLGFHYLDNVTGWIDEIFYSNTTRRQELYDLIADTLQNYQYPMVWVCHSIPGTVYRRGWEIQWNPYANFGNWVYVRYVGVEPSFPPIPGFSIGTILSVSVVTILGAIYVIMQKKKFK